MQDKISCRVYWIHLHSHTDINSEGYVGITVKSVQCRFSEHKNKATRGNRYTISNAILKYGDSLICTELLQGSVEYCRYIENKLRPLPNIGWNINIGGDCPPMTGRKHSESARQKMSISNDRELSRSRAMGNTNGMCQKVGWESVKYKGTQWQNAISIYKTVVEFPSVGFRKIHTLSGLSKEIGDIKQVFNKIKSGWIPETDIKYMSWLSANNKE